VNTLKGGSKVRTYVVQDTPVRLGRGAKDVKLYAPGDGIRLTAGEAKALGDSVRPGTAGKKSVETNTVTASEQAAEQTGGQETVVAADASVSAKEKDGTLPGSAEQSREEPA
jgi:hypothetical protein